MNSHPRFHRKIKLQLAGVALAGVCAVASGAEKPASGAVASGRVELVEEAGTVTLANRDVRLVFNKQDGTLTSLAHHGRELLGGGRGYIQIALSDRNKRVGKWQYRLCRREPGLVEIAFVDAAPQNPFEMAAHYILRAEEPGFHNYLMLGHDVGRSPGAIQLAQYNFCLRADPSIFTVAAVDDRRIKPFPRPATLKPQAMVMDATYRLPDGSCYSKYFYSAAMDERHKVHGMMGEGVGLWIIMASHEHLNGGPEHQELTVHQTDTTPVLLRHFTAAHYGAGQIESEVRQGSWSKASATWFIYVNAGKERAALWQDAKARAEKEAGDWPYPWLDDAQFQLQRGTATGRLVFDDRTSVSQARVILAEHEANPPPLCWQQQWRGYRFHGWTDADGRFNLGKVRPGCYDLYAWRPGNAGQFVRRQVRVEAGRTLDLGELNWPQPRGREQLWQIGVPDRSAGEFGFADDFRQWGLWDKIAGAHPNGATFTVGKSRERDLPFIMAVTQNSDFSWRLPVWRVEFDQALKRTGRAVLTVGIAAFECNLRKSGLAIKVSLNGEEIGQVQDLAQSGAVHRSGVSAAYQEREIAFDAAKLGRGRNVLTLELPAPSRPLTRKLGYPGAAVMFDFLRLEVEGTEPSGRNR